MVAFGLFHGLVLLPTVLSICGPAPAPVGAAASRPSKGGTVSPVDFEVGRPAQQSEVGAEGRGEEATAASNYVTE